MGGHNTAAKWIPMKGPRSLRIILIIWVLILGTKGMTRICGMVCSFATLRKHVSCIEEETASAKTIQIKDHTHSSSLTLDSWSESHAFLVFLGHFKS